MAELQVSKKKTNIILAKNSIDCGFFASLQEEQFVSDEFKTIIEAE